MDVLTLLITEARAARLEWHAEGDRLVIRGPRTAEALARRLGACKGEVMALLVADEPEIAWRVAAFRARIAPHGPIWPVRLRQTALCDTSGHCGLCGDALPSGPTPRFARCQACVRALTLALLRTREGEVMSRATPL